MKYARVINIELKSSQDLEIFYKKWEKWLPENMPKAVSRTLVRTSPNSTLMMAVYESEEIAESAREIVQKFFRSSIRAYARCGGIAWCKLCWIEQTLLAQYSTVRP
jgi:hypothetical protein